MSKTNIGLTTEQLEGSISLLNRVLADEYLLYTKVRKYHWNVTGIHFNDLHKFFQELYEELEIIIDEVAERVRTLNGNAIGTIAEFAKISRLKEAPGDYPGSTEMIKNLLNEYNIVIREIRTDVEEIEEKYNDAGTADFLTGIMEQHEKKAWMLRSLLAE
jgi:starvation-inducible DNA-binding protein